MNPRPRCGSSASPRPGPRPGPASAEDRRDIGRGSHKYALGSAERASGRRTRLLFRQTSKASGSAVPVGVRRVRLAACPPCRGPLPGSRAPAAARSASCGRMWASPMTTTECAAALPGECLEAGFVVISSCPCAAKNRPRSRTRGRPANTSSRKCSANASSDSAARATRRAPQKLGSSCARRVAFCMRAEVDDGRPRPR